MAVELPLPDVDDPHVARFLEAARQGCLEVQRCTGCGYLRWPPGPMCPQCLARPAEWVALSGDGTIWSLAIYHRAFHPAFESRIPYALAIIELDEGVRLMSNVQTDDLTSLHVGQKVSIRFEQVGLDVVVPMFAPAAAR